jgi:Ni,Fe-hydrogenase III large subunit
MAELERVAGHLSDCAAVAEAAGMAAAAAALARLREAVAGAAGIAFGHRLMMDCVIPGGVAADLAPAGADAIRAAARQVMAALPALRPAFAGQDRLAGLAVLRPEAAAALAVGGIVGRASGRDVDLRRDLAASAAAARAFPVSVRTDGDAAARVALRLAEIGHSAALLSEPAVGAADGPLVADLPPADGEGIGWAEGGRGDVWHWLRLEGGQIAAAFARDPGWLVWPALEEAAAGIAPCDLPLVAASFGASVSGMDL